MRVCVWHDAVGGRRLTEVQEPGRRGEEGHLLDDVAVEARVVGVWPPRDGRVLSAELVLVVERIEDVVHLALRERDDTNDDHPGEVDEEDEEADDVGAAALAQGLEDATAIVCRRARQGLHSLKRRQKMAREHRERTHRRDHSTPSSRWGQSRRDERNLYEGGGGGRGVVSAPAAWGEAPTRRRFSKEAHVRDVDQPPTRGSFPLRDVIN